MTRSIREIRNIEVDKMIKIAKNITKYTQIKQQHMVKPTTNTTIKVYSAGREKRRDGD